MSITNLQQARQMYATGQRVAKTLNVKGQPHMLAYITPGEAQTLENLTANYSGIKVYVVADEKVLPEVVGEKSDGYLGVKYEKIVPLLIESIKDLSKKTKKLEREIKILE